MGILRNEEGVTLIATIILLLFIGTFILSIISSYQQSYANYHQLQLYYEAQANMLLEQSGNDEVIETELSVEEVDEDNQIEPEEN